MHINIKWQLWGMAHIPQASYYAHQGKEWFRKRRKKQAQLWHVLFYNLPNICLYQIQTNMQESLVENM